MNFVIIVFHADDMLHPSPVAVSYLWECFTECYFSKETDRIMKEWEDIRKALAHKPFNAQSETYRKFLTQIVLKIERLKEKFPYFDLQKELEQCQARLKNYRKRFWEQSGLGTRSAQIDWILTDSRSLCFPEETLFFSL